jgi:hypothetical protein
MSQIVSSIVHCENKIHQFFLNLAKECRLLLKNR